MLLRKIVSVGVFLFFCVSMLSADNRYRQVFNEVAGIIERNFYDEVVIRKRFSAVRKQYESKLGSVKSETEFAGLINSMLGELKASHTRYYTKNEPGYYQLCSIFEFLPEIKKLFNEKPVLYPGTGISAEKIDGKVFITSVLEGSPAQKTGVLRGDEIVLMNGRPFISEQSLADNSGRAVVLELRRTPDGQVLKMELSPVMVSPKEEALAAERESVKIFKEGNKNIGYIHIWSYAGEEYHQEFLQAISFGKLKDADALILDLRDGWGGANPDYLNVFNSKVPVLESIERGGKKSVYDPQWRKPVVLLVNGGVRSGKEILAYGFKKYNIGKVIGEKTAGAVLAGKPFVVSDGSLLYLAAKNVKVDGEVLEGKGVEPDIHVPLDIRYSQGKDTQLESSLRYVSDLLK